MLKGNSMIYHHLYQWGLSAYFERKAQNYKNLSLARVTEQHHTIYKVICEDGKGCHTTTHRQLIANPGRGIVIDTPGMRDLGLENADLEKSFSDIENIADQCKIRDCSHSTEPGCAIRSAIENGVLDSNRPENYKKIQTEIGYAGLSSRQVEEEKINRVFGGKNQMKKIKK